jgi:hypothetical protein
MPQGNSLFPNYSFTPAVCLGSLQQKKAARNRSGRARRSSAFFAFGGRVCAARRNQRVWPEGLC